MNRDELAAKLTGAEYPFDVPSNLNRAAKDAGLVVVFGSSDDLMEFRGAIHDEIGAWAGRTAHITRNGLLTNECEDENCPHFERAKSYAAKIDALWCDEPGYSWTYGTKIPHATFEIVEDGEPYCRGIVFALSDVA